MFIVQSFEGDFHSLWGFLYALQKMYKLGFVEALLLEKFFIILIEGFVNEMIEHFIVTHKNRLRDNFALA